MSVKGQVKVRYDDGELSAVRRAAAAAGLRPGGYVASAALAMARQLVDPAVSDTGARLDRARSWRRRRR